MIGYRPSGGFAQRGLSTTVKIPRLWTSPFDRNVATTKLCVQNISILQFCRICIPAGLPGDQPAAASDFSLPQSGRPIAVLVSAVTWTYG